MFYDKTTPTVSYAGFKQAVNETIARLLGGIEPAELRQALVHATIGGKRVRPVLTMLSCAAVGGRTRNALNAATAVELLHTSSLVHDDIMDNAHMRRGIPTIHSRFGTSMGVLTGDTLIALAFQLIQETNSPSRHRIVERFTRAFLHTCEGQGLDLALAPITGAARDSHRLMVEKKTARLLEAAASIGGMIGTANEDYVRALGKFGFELGMAFQAKDDLLDQTGDEKTLGKPVLADLRNGKMTYLTFAAANGVHRDENSWTDAADQVGLHTRSACAVLDVLPPSPARESLKEFADALLIREQ